MEAAKETKFGTKGMRMIPELFVCRIDAEKARDTTLDDENNRNILECCNNTYQGAPHTDNRVLALRSSVMAVTLLVVVNV